LKSSENRKFLLVFLTITLISTVYLRGFNVGGFNFYVNNEFLYNINNTYEKSNQFYETLSIFANKKKWSFQLTLRVNNFSKRNPNFTLANTNFDIFRSTIRFNSKKLKLTLGDFYSVLGHGLVLSIQKNDEIFLERTILGADIKYISKNFNIRIIGGEIYDDYNNQLWDVIGGEADLKLNKNHRLAGRFSYIIDHDTIMQLGNRLTYSLSLNCDKLFKHFSYYAEYAILNFGENYYDNGEAFYSNVTFNRSHTTITVEYKNYKNFDNELNNLPVADREDEISPVGDTEGIRVLFQYTIFDPEISFYLNLGHYREYDYNGSHIYAGISALDIGEKVSFNLSYGVRNIIYPIKKSYIDLTWQLSDYVSFTVSSKDKRYRDNYFKFNEQDHSIQFSHSKGVSVFFSYQYSYSKVIGLNHFFSGGLVLDFHNDMKIRITGGTIRGGQVCSGGQCYILPPFKGIKLSILKTFK